MTTLTLEIPLPESVTVTEHDAKMMLAGKMFEDGLLSSGQAADMVGITKREFIETIGKYGISVFQATPEEAERDHQWNVRRLKDGRARKQYA